MEGRIVVMKRIMCFGRKFDKGDWVYMYLRRGLQWRRVYLETLVFDVSDLC